MSNTHRNRNRDDYLQRVSQFVIKSDNCPNIGNIEGKTSPSKVYSDGLNFEHIYSTQNQAPSRRWDPAIKAVTSAAKAHMSNSNSALEIGMHVGQRVFVESTSRMIPGLEKSIDNLRIYFAVNNLYVKKKICRVLFSFFYTYWKRRELDPSEKGISNQRYSLPVYDENSFDLYIPTMSLITHVLLCAICYGSTGDFDPDFLSNTAKNCFFTQILEVLFYRFCFYLMRVPCKILDLFAMSGYKYLGLCVNTLLGLVIVRFGYIFRIYHVIFLWTACATSYFLLKTMANLIPMDAIYMDPKRHIIISLSALVHFLTILYLCETKILN